MSEQITAIPKKQSINCRGKLIDFSTPCVMGVLNLSPDSFYDGGKYITGEAMITRASQLLEEGACILDIGAASSRPGANAVEATEELDRLLPAVSMLREHFPDAVLSIDTYRADVARAAIEAGADMVNDISGGNLDKLMFETIAQLQVPYVLMHMQGNPQTMQQDPQYGDVCEEVLTYMIDRTYQLRQLGVHDVIIDPGFGFGKTLAHNFELLNNLHRFNILGLPILVGFSRKSMVNKVLGCRSDEALNGTTVLNTLALERGAGILRVHDAKEAAEAIKLVQALKGMKP